MATKLANIKSGIDRLKTVASEAAEGTGCSYLLLPSGRKEISDFTHSETYTNHRGKELPRLNGETRDSRPEDILRHGIVRVHEDEDDKQEHYIEFNGNHPRALQHAAVIAEHTPYPTTNVDVRDIAPKRADDYKVPRSYFNFEGPSDEAAKHLYNFMRLQKDPSTAIHSRPSGEAQMKSGESLSKFRK